MPGETTPPDSNPRQHWALAILCLLRERPMHPYEMRRLTALRHKDERLELKPGSLYNAAEWLAKQALIAVSGSGRQGQRPKRTTYRITPAGEAILGTWLTEMLARPQRDASSFSVALDHLLYISPPAADSALERRRAALTGTIADMKAAIKTLRPRIGRINLIEVEHDLALARAELGWIGTVLDDLRRGRLQWNTEEILKTVRPPADKSTATADPATVRRAARPQRSIKSRSTPA